MKVLNGTQIQINYSSVFSDDNKNLYTKDYSGNIECIGVTKEEYLALKEDCEMALLKAEEYFEELVEAGLKERPKTEAERIDELEQKLIEANAATEKVLEQNAKMLAMLEKMTIGVENDDKSESVSKKGGTKRQSDKQGNSSSEQLQQRQGGVNSSDKG